MRAVIMGGTSGIGLATARRLTADGIDVTVTGRNTEKVAEVGPEFAGAEAVDGTDVDALKQFFDGFGSFEHLVLTFSPGRLGGGPLRQQQTLDAMRATFDGKFFAYMSAIQLAPVTSSITVVSAASARSSRAGSVIAAAVNGALDRVVAPLASELAPVRVNAVSPGVVDTPWWSFMAADAREKMFADLAAGLPVGRVAKPEDVGDAIAYLVGAGFVTGTILSVDGGFTVP